MGKKYRSIAAVLLLVTAAAAGIVYAKTYFKAHTHEYALMQIITAIETKDQALFAEYADVDRVLFGIHENISELLGEHIEVLHERHPDDWFFRHDAAFMENYMAERRPRDVAAARLMLDYYFDDTLVPVTREDGAARWWADELRMFAAHYNAGTSAVEDGEARAVYMCRLQGDESAYGRLLPAGYVMLVLEKQENGRWKLVQAVTNDNAEEGFYAFVDAAERYWALQGWD